MYSNCKAVSSAYKLSTLYVVDSIVRVYVDEARKQNQAIDSKAPEGTFASGAFKISELIESLVDDALELMISQSQRIKIGKLVDIWERAETFSPEILKSIKSKHFASTTPPGSPPKISVEPVKPSENNGQSDSTSILLALASLAKSNSNSNTPSSESAIPAKPPVNANNILSQLSALAGNNSGDSSQSPQNYQNNAPSLGQQPGQAQGQNEQYIFNMLQQMQKNGTAGVGPNNSGLPKIPQVPQLPQIPQQGNDYSRRGRDDGANYSRRNRSRSPPRYSNNNNNRRDRSPPRQQYGNNQYGIQQQGMGQMGQPMGQMGLPMGQMGLPMNQIDTFLPPGSEMNVQGTPHYRPRNLGFDQTLPQGSFKVLSRTLFIGGVPRNMGEKELASVLRPFAEVQSVILNSERKHAFVKVYSRREAEQVITSFNKDNSLPLRTRWGVGFGPRDCCNYQHGISIIPIQRLTDADKAWVVKAQWGGTGGQPLQSGMVIDEPDIEIGSGISSKAMSKKMPTNSARNGPKSNRPGEPDEDYVKTTLIQQPNNPSPQQPDFASMNQSINNPLSGLFGNNPPPINQGYQQNPGHNGFQGNVPNFNNMQAQGNPDQNPNLSAQLANFFQNGSFNR